MLSEDSLSAMSAKYDTRLDDYFKNNPGAVLQFTLNKEDPRVTKAFLGMAENMNRVIDDIIIEVLNR